MLQKILYKHQMHGYQNTATKHIVDESHTGLFMEMGLGKTVVTLTAIDVLIYAELEIDTVLVVAPKRIVEHTWHTEAAKWEHLKHLTFSRIIGTPKQRKKALLAKANIYLISRDNIAWLCALYGGSSLPFDMLVLDESSSFKNPKSVRFRALRGVQPSFTKVLILTGTPAPNGLLDIWSQIYLLDRGKRLGKSLQRYKDTYFKPNARNGSIIFNYKIGEGAEEAIYDKIGDVVVSMRVKDYLTLPPVISNMVEITLPAKVQKQYEDFEREQVLEMFNEDEDDISAVNAAALSNKLLQFANGAVYDDDKNIHEVHNAKLDALEEIIELANGKPVLVARAYKHDKLRIEKRLAKYNPTELKSNDEINLWNAGKIPLLVMHPSSGGHGLNLQAGGSIIVWFGLTWSLELYQQLNARLDRQGQKDTVIIHHLLVKNTIDYAVMKAIDRKEKGQNGLMNAVKLIKQKVLEYKKQML